ncbi:hypothetical protein BpHYR1_008357, partial [Brachionus plicatilis]
YGSSDKDRYKQIDNRQKQIIPRDNFILVLIINCAMSEIGSIIEDIDSKKWKKIKALNICKAKSLAYSLDKVVAAFRATVAELKDIADKGYSGQIPKTNKFNFNIIERSTSCRDFAHH